MTNDTELQAGIRRFALALQAATPSLSDAAEALTGWRRHLQNMSVYVDALAEFAREYRVLEMETDYFLAFSGEDVEE